MDSCTYTKLPPPVDIEADYPTKAQQQGRPVKTRSCLKTCLFVTVIVISVLVGMALAGAYMWTAGHVRKWTVTQPNNDIPIIEVSKEDLEVFKDQAKMFFDLIQADQVPPDDFVATATNLNGLAASSDFLRGNSYAELKTNQVTMNLSLPMDGFPGGKGRFLVGTETLSWDPDTAVIHAKMESPLDDTKNDQKTFYDMQFHLGLMDDGMKWNLTILSGQFLDWTVPQDFIEEHNNLLDVLLDCDDDDDDDCKAVRKVVEGLDEVSLEKDQVAFHARPKSGSSRRVLTDAEKWSSNYKIGWKLQLAQRLAF